jgi:chitodextrinase
MKECGDAEAKQQIWLRKKIYEDGDSSAQSGNAYYFCVIQNPVLQEALS